MSRILPVVSELFGVAKPVIGMLHAPPLAGSPGYDGKWENVRAAVLRDAEVLASEGVHGLLLENFGDAPFYPRRVPAVVVAQMTALAVEVRRHFEKIPLGINILRNDGRSALAVAAAAQAQFVRVNVLCGARVTDQGLLQGIAHQLLRDRSRLGASVRIFADVDVKHSAALAPRPIEEEARETVERGGADALIVSGSGTGMPTGLAKLQQVLAAAQGVPVLVGSGVTAETLPAYLDLADGFILGTSIKRDGVTTNCVDPKRVREFMDRWRLMAAAS